MENNLRIACFKQFSQLVYERCGINLHEGKKALLQARLNKRLRMTGIGSYEEYFKYITSAANPGEFVHFLDSISTNLTYFFRESQHFDFLEQVALPELIERKQKDEGFQDQDLERRVFDRRGTIQPCDVYAGTPAGHLAKWDFRILATDISTRALEAASGGVYSEDKVQKVPPALRQVNFHKISNGNGRPEYEIAPHVKRIVTFHRLNLKEPYPFKGRFDFIFCRNVMIYFDKKTQRGTRQQNGELSEPRRIFLCRPFREPDWTGRIN